MWPKIHIIIKKSNVKRLFLKHVYFFRHCVPIDISNKICIIDTSYLMFYKILQSCSKEFIDDYRGSFCVQIKASVKVAKFARCWNRTKLAQFWSFMLYNIFFFKFWFRQVKNWLHVTSTAVLYVEPSFDKHRFVTCYHILPVGSSWDLTVTTRRSCITIYEEWRKWSKSCDPIVTSWVHEIFMIDYAGTRTDESFSWIFRNI
jgi:hypothetical protein